MVSRSKSKTRYGLAVCKLQQGPMLLIKNLCGRATGKEEEKARTFNSINSRMKEIKTAYNISLTIVAGDFNVDLDMIEKSAKKSYEALKLLISDHSLVDSFRICHPDRSSAPG